MNTLIIIGKTSCEQQQFPCVRWRSGENVSIKFVERLSLLKIPMRCIMHTSIFILCYNHPVLQVCMSDVCVCAYECIAQRIRHFEI